MTKIQAGEQTTMSEPAHEEAKRADIAGKTKIVSPGVDDRTNGHAIPNGVNGNVEKINGVNGINGHTNGHVIGQAVGESS